MCQSLISAVVQYFLIVESSIDIIALIAGYDWYHIRLCKFINLAIEMVTSPIQNSSMSLNDC